MTTKPIAERLLWALETLAVNPSDRLLELGCGNGALISYICKRLDNGAITAIDRSETMIEIAKKTNAEFVSEGKASFLAAPFHEAALNQSRFDKIFAVNVNLFWMKADRELAMIRKLLLPGGAVYLFNQPPKPEQVNAIAEKTKQNLLNAGFEVRPIVLGDQNPVPVVCVIGELG
ncbi:class I SAM-dependent methyltransferase [Paenibacillus thermotolerans]|uniref:class I SAM-dependent methyltransferase n=1 Tax=Paenibacillus thermotolerans TaxID=3027807 RepID=UPI002368565C|nr:MULTISPECIES: class I SAM-dependent methyltransferase [unclassified Paenibacillus]